MNHVLGAQLTCAGDRRLAERQRPDAIAFFLNRRTSLAPNRARHAPAQLQVIVCGVHDCIGRCLGQIAVPESYLVAPFGSHRAHLLQCIPDWSAIIRAVRDDPKTGGDEDTKKPGDHTCARPMRSTGVWMRPSGALSGALP